jgi:hypothetical protein
VSKAQFFLNFLLLLHFSGYSQKMATISGKVTDAASGNPIPFVNLVLKGTNIGVTTDFEGYYTLQVNVPADSLIASYIGYKTKTKALNAEPDQVINFQMEEEVVNLQELVFESGENPAYAILRKVIDQKKRNDKRELGTYRFESYTKIELDINNLSEKFRERKLVSKIKSVLDSIQTIAGEDGQPVLPVFLSESISRVSVSNNPEAKKEEVLKSRVRGLGIEDGSLVSQVIGSSFQEYNFYRNWLRILEKDFVSPIADGWRIYYDYDLSDSLMVEGDFCYRLDIYPRRKEDLAFSGTMWITKRDYALKQIDVSIDKATNLNFIDNIRIQQALEPSEEGPWLPSKTRVLIDIGQLTKETAGMLAKFYVSNQDWELNLPVNQKYFDQPITLAEDALINDDQYWEKARHDSLSTLEKNVFVMIDTLTKIPSVRTYVDLVKFMLSGYNKTGKIEWGPYLYLYSNNNIEGHRLRIGFRTNEYFSKKFILRGYGAYGFGDQRIKYGAYLGYLPSRNPWTLISYEYKNDLDQVGLPSDNLGDNYIFYAFTRFGQFIRPYLHQDHQIKLETQLRRGLIQRVAIKRMEFEPLYLFSFYKKPGDSESPVASNFVNSELTFQTRFAPDEVFLQNGNERISLGGSRKPEINLTYSLGLKGMLGSDFNYHKLSLDYTQKINLGLFGVSRYTITGGHVFGTLPYPLLNVHIGNESPFYTTAAFNLMNFFEFVSDSYVSLRYNHYFEGFLLNRIPLLRKLKWRMVGSANVLSGSATQENLDIIPEQDQFGNSIPRFGVLGGTPYVELGYGIENIFKIIRVDAFHRLTYLDNPGARKFGVKISFQFIL